jgi:hypothetical protein
MSLLTSWLDGFWGLGFWGLGKSWREEASTAHAALAALDIPLAISKLENWKRRLQAYLDGSSKEVFDAYVVCFDDRCDLGQWIHAQGKAAFTGYPRFAALMSHHKMLHFAASNIIALHERGKAAEAQLILQGQFTQFAKSVVGDLNGLSDMLTPKQ